MALLDDFRSLGVAVYKGPDDVPFVRDDSWGSFKGSYGTVFRATRRSGRPSRPSIGQEDAYAIKEIHALSAKDQLDVAREIRLLQQFRHDNILELESAFIIDIPGHKIMNTIRLVTKPWAPVSLHHFIQDLASSSGVSTMCAWFKPRAIDPWPSILRQCLSGLAYLHSQRPKAIRHKDIKPHNILLAFEANNSKISVRPIIIDFGISKEYIDGATTANTGTYEYKAPEQIRKQNPTLASDIFSLGCCFALIEGILRPWPGLPDVHKAAMETDACQFASNVDLINTVLQDQKKPSTFESPTVGYFCTPFRSLVRQMLAIEPANRPTAEQALDTITRLESEFAYRSEITKQAWLAMPPSLNRDFVGRRDLLNQLYQQCSEPGRRVALVGLGGVGKSQLAIEFAYRIAEQEAERPIFWFCSETHAHVKEGFQKLAEAVKLPGRNQPEANIPKLVYDWLSEERNGQWIIILDRADESDVLCGPSDGGEGKPFMSYLPQNQTGSILITTRDKSLPLSLVENIIELNPMVPDEAVLLLERRLGRVSDVNTARELVQILGHLPLAISQMTSYAKARSSRISAEELLATIRSAKERAYLGHNESGQRLDASRIDHFLQIMFRELQSESPSAMHLLLLMSFFDPDGIDRSLLNSIVANHVPGHDTNSDIDSDLDILMHSSLIRKNENGSLAMHRLTREAAQVWLKGDVVEDQLGYL